MRPLPETIQVDGQRRSILDRKRVGRKEYWILERLSHGERERSLVFDPTAGPRGDLRALLILPFSRATLQHLAVLQRLTHHHASFPSILEYHRHDHQIFLVQSWVRG